MRPLLSFLQLLLLHAALLLGVQRKVPLPERLWAYPGQLLGALRPEVLSVVWPQLLLTAAYLLGGLLLAWLLVGLLGRWARGLLWVIEGLPPFLLLVLGVWLGLWYTVPRGLDFPLTPWAGLMLGLFTTALALPAAARAALASGQVRNEALRADFTRTARSMGLPESQVRQQAARVALPERAAALAGESLTLALALVVMEGLLQFPGVGNSVYVALQAALSGVGEVVAGQGRDGLLAVQTLSAALLWWLLLGVGGAGFWHWVAARLDPRPRSGEEPT